MDYFSIIISKVKRPMMMMIIIIIIIIMFEILKKDKIVLPSSSALISRSGMCVGARTKQIFKQRVRMDLV
jgi:hypothetical protein